jgi:diguanylate cyclase (GGDEF)-like protein
LLAEIGYRLKSALRLIDYAFRYGGDEFVVLLPQTNKEQAQVVARRLREVIRTQPFHIDGVSLNVKSSMGVASYPEDAKSAHEIIRQADEMMYMVKNTSRDSIAVAQQGMLR